MNKPKKQIVIWLAEISQINCAEGIHPPPHTNPLLLWTLKWLRGLQDVVSRRSETDQYWSRLGAVRLSDYFINPDETPIAFLNSCDLMVLSFYLQDQNVLTCADINSIRFATSINLEVYENKFDEKYLHVYI